MGAMSRGAHVSTFSRIAFAGALGAAALFTFTATPEEPAGGKPAPVDYVTQIKPATGRGRRPRGCGSIRAN